MKNKINQLTGLFLIVIIVFSSVSFGDNGVTEETAEKVVSPEQEFRNNPHPTAADLANLPNPTVDDFSRLNPVQQAEYLAWEGKYRDDFAEKFYSNANNVGKNEKVDKIYFAKKENIGENNDADKKFFADYGTTKLGEFLKTVDGMKEAADSYFSKNFPSPESPANFQFLEIGSNFKFDASKSVLINDDAEVSINNPLLESVVATLDNILPQKHGLKTKYKGQQEVMVTGDVEINYDEKEKKVVFTDAQGKKQSFDILLSEEETSLRFDKDRLVVKGAVSGTIKTKDDFAKFSNHAGTLVIYSNGDIDAENAEVITSKLYADGYYKKRGNIIEAWDVGDKGKKTVIIDRTSCVDFRSCIGTRTQGRVNPTAQEEVSGIKKSTLTVHLDEISPNSQFYQTPEQKAALEKPKEEEKKGKTPSDEEQQQNVDFFRKQAQELRKPCSARQGCEPLEGNNAEVFFHHDEKTGVITTSSRGSVEVGLFDIAGDKATPLPSRFHYSGKNGNSELDVELLRGKNNYNILGQGDLTAEHQSITGEQDGASVKFTASDFANEEIVRADCFNCGEGKAVTIKKKVAIVSALPGGLFSEAEPSGVTLTVNVDSEGKLKFQPSRQDLGILAAQRTEQILQEDPAKRVAIGNNFFMEVPCGENKCEFQLTSDPLSGEPGAKYSLYDPKTNQKQEVAYHLNVQTVLGREVVISSKENIENFQKYEEIIRQGKENLQKLSELSFDKTDPGYEAWRKKILQETGIDPSRFDDKAYVQNIGSRIEKHEKAIAIIEKLGIRIDERGRGITPKDQERINQILSKGSGYDAEYDQLSQALLILARNKIDEVADELKSCAGTTHCTVSQKDLKAAEISAEKIQKQREGALSRLTVAEQKFEQKRLQEEAKKRQTEPNKGVTKDEAAVVQELGSKIERAQRKKISDATNLDQKSRDKKEQTDRLAEYIRTNFNKYEAQGVRFDKLGNPEYRKQLLEDRAREYPGLLSIHADLEYTEQWMAQLSSNIARAEAEETRSRDALNAIVQQRLGKEDDIAAELYNLGGQPALAQQVAEQSPLIPDDIRPGLVDRYSTGAAEDSFKQVRFLASNGRVAEATQMRDRILAENPNAAQLAEAEYDSANQEINRVAGALLDEARAEKLVKIRELQRKRYERKYGAQQEFFNAARSWGTGGSLIEAIQNPGLAAANYIESSGRLVYAGAMDVFKDLEDSGSYVLGHTFGDQSLNDAKASMEKDAEKELNRQAQELEEISQRIRAYNQQGKTAAQAFAEARKEGQYLSPEARLVELQTQGEDVDIDVPATTAEMEQLKKNIEKYPDHPDKEKWEKRITLLEQIRDEKIAKAVVDAENEQMVNYGTFALAEDKWRVVAELDPNDPRAIIAQQQIKQLDRNVLGEAFGEVYGETAGEIIGGEFSLLNLVGIELSERTSRTVVEDLAISTFDLTISFDIAGAAVAVPVLFVKYASKFKKGERAIQAGRQMLQRSRYALYGSEKSVTAFEAARKTLQVANSDKQVVKATETLNLARKEYEVARGTAKETPQLKKLFDAEDVLRTAEDTAGVTRARTDLARAEAAVEADITAQKAAALARKQTSNPSALKESLNRELDNIAANSPKREKLAKRLQSQEEEIATIPDYREADKMTAQTIARQTTDELTAVDYSIAQSKQRVNELDGLIKATSLAGNKPSRTWERTIGKLFPPESKEIADAKIIFRKAQDDFVAAKNKIDLVGNSEEAALSRAKLERARNQLEAAAATVEKAQDSRKSEQLASSVEDTARYYEGAPVCGFAGAAAGLESCIPPDEVRLSPEEARELDDLTTELGREEARLEVVEVEGKEVLRYQPETVPESLRLKAERAEELIERASPKLTPQLTDVRTEADLRQSFAQSEYAAAQGAKPPTSLPSGEMVARRKLPTPEEGIDLSDLIEPCAIAGGAIVGMAPCVSLPGFKDVKNLQKGEAVKIESASGVSYTGRFLGIEQNKVLIQSAGEVHSVPVGEVKNLIKEGQEVRIIDKGGNVRFGKYGSEGQNYFVIIDSKGKGIPFPKENLDFSTLISLGDDIQVQSFKGDTFVGKYHGETDTVILIEEIPGKVTILAKEKLKLNTLGKMPEKVQRVVSVPIEKRIATPAEIAMTSPLQAAAGRQVKPFDIEKITQTWEYLGELPSEVISTHPIVRYKDPSSGVEVLLKGGPQHTTQADYIGQRIFALGGLPVPETTLVEHEGQLKQVIRFIPNFEAREAMPVALHNDEVLQSGFALDALINNYDRVDRNMLYLGDHFVFIDQGASTGSSAMGRFKAFPDTVDVNQIRVILTDPLRGGSVNPAYDNLLAVTPDGKLFVKNRRIVEDSIRRLRSITDEQIDAIVDDAYKFTPINEQRKILAERIKHLQTQKTSEAQKALETALRIQNEFGGSEATYYKHALKSRRDSLANLLEEAIHQPTQSRAIKKSEEIYELDNREYSYFENAWFSPGETELETSRAVTDLDNIVQLEAARLENVPMPLVEKSVKERFLSLAELRPDPKEGVAIVVSPKSYESSVIDLVDDVGDGSSLTKDNIKELVLLRARREVEAGKMTPEELVALERDFDTLYSISRGATGDVAEFSQILRQQTPGFTNVHLFRDGSVLGASDELAQRLAGVSDPDVRILYVSRDSTLGPEDMERLQKGEISLEQAKYEGQTEIVKDLMTEASIESTSFLEFRQKFQTKFSNRMKTDAQFREVAQRTFVYMIQEGLIKDGAKLRFIDTCCTGSVNYFLEGIVRYYRPDIEVESLLMSSTIRFPDGTLSANLNGIAVEELFKPVRFSGSIDELTGTPLMSPTRSGELIGGHPNYYGEHAEQVLSFLDELVALEQTVKRANIKVTNI